MIAYSVAVSGWNTDPEPVTNLTNYYISSERSVETSLNYFIFFYEKRLTWLKMIQRSETILYVLAKMLPVYIAQNFFRAPFQASLFFLSQISEFL